MCSIRHFVILLSAAIILLIGCSALAHILELVQTVVANSPATRPPILAQGVVSAFASFDLASLIGHIAAPTVTEPSAP